jgi:hypothetical protein
MCGNKKKYTVMKKVNLVLLIFVCVNSIAQLPKGDRILAWQVDMAENANYDSAFYYAQSSCMESIHLFYTWSGIEPSVGNFDAAFIKNTLDIANTYYPAYNTKVELQIAPINTNVKETPSELISTKFSDQTMIDRFKVLLDTVFKHIPNIELSALNIGNESEIFMGINESLYSDYKTFLDSVIPYAKQLYYNLHEKDLKVGTTFTFDGLTSESMSALCQSVNSNLDIVTLTYYPLNPDFTMKAPDVVDSDFADLVSIYPDTLQPIYLAECGYSSSSTCNSSEAQQAEFYRNLFFAWDKYMDNIKYLTIFKTTDWSQQEVDDLGVYYGLTDTIFLEYLRTLGVRTWNKNGSNKLAYETILCELNAREWCSTKCNISSSTKNLSNSLLIKPNPTKGTINIITKSDIKNIWIYDSLGKLCLTSITNEIILNGLPGGTYILVVELESGEICRNKIVKI